MTSSIAEWKDDFIESYVQIGVEQGLEQGAANAKAQDVLKVVERRGLRATRNSSLRSRQPQASPSSTSGSTGP